MDLASPDAAGSALAALGEFGALGLVNHGLGNLDVVLGSVRSTFEVPQAEKEVATAAPSARMARGYIPSGGESGSALLREAKEGFSFGHPMGVEENRWPASLASRPALERAYGDLCRAARTVVTTLSTRIDRLAGCCGQDADQTSLVRLFHYLPAIEDKVVGSSPHTDWGMLTLVISDDAHRATPGLEIWHRGAWRGVRVPPDAVVLNAGDYLSLVSGGAARSPRHRVVSPTPPDHRFSLVFFYYPDSKAKIPAPAFPPATDDLSLLDCQVAATENEPPPCANADVGLTFGEYIARKWREVAR